MKKNKVWRITTNDQVPADRRLRPCLLMKENENGIIIICLYIDNTLCVGDKLEIEK